MKGVIGFAVFAVMMALAVWGRSRGVWRRSRTTVIPLGEEHRKLMGLEEDDAESETG